VAPPTARFQIAFDDDTLEADPDWTDMDDIVRVSEYSIDRGRSFEMDRVDAGRATVLINDTEGILDPTNPGSPYSGKIMPLKQARLALWNPVLEDWYTRFRGFVESYEYEFDPSQLVNRVTISLVDIFEIVSAVQMFPGYFGFPPPTTLTGQVVFFEDTPYGDLHGMQYRITAILNNAPLGNCGIDPSWYDVFSGNVGLHETSYSPGESAMTAIQDASDAEFPSVSNVYGDRLGRLACHGRYARFDPVSTSAATGWDFHDWKAGDHAAVAATPTMAQLRSFAISRDLSKIINHALCSPVTAKTDPDFEGNVVQSDPSKGLYGIRAWSSQDLIVKEGVTDGFLADPDNPADETASWDECRRFADYYVRNYQAPHNRITEIGFRSMPKGKTAWSQAATDTWALMSEVDINDRVAVTIGSPGGGGFAAKKFFVEGVHETYRPAGPDVDDVTLALDLSPDDYFQDSPFPTP
jgi:hypothetical protein